MKFLPILACCLSIFSQINAQCVSTETTASGSHAPSSICKGDLIFQDEFDTFDRTIWTFERMTHPYNHEFEYYTDQCCENTFVEDGVLNIKPSLTYGANRNLNGSTREDLSPVTSARLLSRKAFNFKYGRVEIRAKTPTGDWLWPALWMLPKDDTYGDDPRSGEIDILETRGNTQYTYYGTEFGTKFMESTLHWGPDDEHNQAERTTYSNVNKSSPYNTGFHKYGIEWTSDHFEFLLDDRVLGRVAPPDGGFWELGELSNSGYDNIWAKGGRMAPFDREFFFIFNVAIGGDYFPDDADNRYPKPWKDGSRTARDDFWNARRQWLSTWNLDGSNDAALQIDYIRVYAL